MFRPPMYHHPKFTGGTPQPLERALAPLLQNEGWAQVASDPQTYPGLYRLLRDPSAFS